MEEFSKGATLLVTGVVYGIFITKNNNYEWWIYLILGMAFGAFWWIIYLWWKTE